MLVLALACSIDSTVIKTTDTASPCQDSETAWYTDADGDGYGDDAEPTFGCDVPEGAVTEAGDCDDNDASVHPSASELCDELDQDCDGAVDEDLGIPEGWIDADSDGYGDPEGPNTACALPAGYVANDDDCDDTDPTIGPASPGGSADSDGDGYGDPESPVEGCESGVADATDCDDTTAATNPGAEEAFGNGVDDDCDGAAATLDMHDVFPESTNPDGDWIAGWAAGAPDGAFTPFGYYAVLNTSIDYWSPTNTSRYPGLYRNGSTEYHSGASFFYADTIGLHPGSAGEYAVLRWTAPGDTGCVLDVEFVNYEQASTAVAVYAAGTAVDAGHLTYPSVTSYAVSASVSVVSGDTIDFSVGPDGNYAYDITGVLGTIACL